MEFENKRKLADRRSGKERRQHDMDELYEQALRKKIVKERRSGEERRKMKRRTSDKPKLTIRATIKKAEEEWLS